MLLAAKLLRAGESELSASWRGVEGKALEETSLLCRMPTCSEARDKKLFLAKRVLYSQVHTIISRITPNNVKDLCIKKLSYEDSNDSILLSSSSWIISEKEVHEVKQILNIKAYRPASWYPILLQ